MTQSHLNQRMICMTSLSHYNHTSNQPYISKCNLVSVHLVLVELIISGGSENLNSMTDFWLTDYEIKLLLNVIHEYKILIYLESADWESLAKCMTVN